TGAMPMQFVFNPGLFALGVAVGGLGLVVLLSLIISYAYDERTLLVLGCYVLLMAAITLLGQRWIASVALIKNLLLIAGPALITALLAYLLSVRNPGRAVKAIFLVVGLVTLGVLVLYSLLAPADVTRVAALSWAVLLLAFAIYLVARSWDTTGPWKWWLLAGHVAGLVTSVCLLTGFADVQPAYWPVPLMILVQVPPIYLSLVWRSRLLNESRLRSLSANVTDPLTGLATTMVLVERLMRVTSRMAPQVNSRNALFVIEVQNWQALLNEMGTEFNEKLLLEAAMRLRRAIGDNDLAARISGGRFAILTQGLRSDEEVNALATRLVVSGLRIDSPLLERIEFRFRVLVSQLRIDKPMALRETNDWLDRLIGQFLHWPRTHRSRSILVVSEDDLNKRGSPTPETAF
ncbi:MAG: GGDEF domain-containing protein, partial [Rhodoferax sp.]